MDLGKLRSERLGDVLNVTQPMWERGLDLRDFGKLVVASSTSLEKMSGDKRMLGTQQGTWDFDGLGMYQFFWSSCGAGNCHWPKAVNNNLT